MGLFPIVLSLLAVSAIVPVTLQGPELDSFFSQMLHNSKKLDLIHTQDGKYRWVANQPISRGEPILGIPLTMCLTSFETFPLTPHLSDLHPDQVLTVRLLYEKFMAPRGGFHNSYVHSLPTNLTLLALWTDEEKDRLQTEINYGMQVKLQSDITNSYYTVKKRLKTVEIPTEMMEWDSWAWAFMIAQTKAFQLDRYLWLIANGYPAEERDKGILGGGFYPLIDLIGHWPLQRKERGEVQHTVVMQGGKVPGPIFFADRNFVPKQEIFYHHRNMSNYELLYLYGYIIDHNPDETFEVNGGDDPNCPAIQRKSECWFPLGPFSVNFTLLNWLRLLKTKSVIRATPKNILSLYVNPPLNETQAAFTQSLVLYRMMVVDRMERSSSVPLRKQVRALQLVNDTVYQLTVGLGVSQKRLMHRQLRLVDKEMMKLLAGALGI